MSKPVIDPNTLTDEQKEFIINEFNESDILDVADCLVRIFGGDIFEEPQLCAVGDIVRKISNGKTYKVTAAYLNNYCWHYELQGYPFVVYGDEIEVIRQRKE